MKDYATVRPSDLYDQCLFTLKLILNGIECNLTVATRDANFSGNVKTVGNIPEIFKKKIGNIPKFSDL